MSQERGGVHSASNHKLFVLTAHHACKPQPAKLVQPTRPCHFIGERVVSFPNTILISTSLPASTAKHSLLHSHQPAGWPQLQAPAARPDVLQRRCEPHSSFPVLAIVTTCKSKLFATLGFSKLPLTQYSLIFKIVLSRPTISSARFPKSKTSASRYYCTNLSDSNELSDSTRNPLQHIEMDIATSTSPFWAELCMMRPHPLSSAGTPDFRFFFSLTQIHVQNQDAIGAYRGYCMLKERSHRWVL